MLTKIIIKWKAKQKAKDYNRGFQWAAGQLLNGRQASELRQFVYEASDFDNRTAFDDGIVCALIKWDGLFDKPTSFLSK